MKKLTELIAGEIDKTIRISETRVAIAHEDVKPIGMPIIVDMPTYSSDYLYKAPKEIINHAPKNANAYLVGRSVCLKGDLTLMKPLKVDKVSEKMVMNVYYNFYPVQYYKIRKERE